MLHYESKRRVVKSDEQVDSGQFHDSSMRPFCFPSCLWMAPEALSRFCFERWVRIGGFILVVSSGKWLPNRAWDGLSGLSVWGMRKRESRGVQRDSFMIDRCYQPCRGQEQRNNNNSALLNGRFGTNMINTLNANLVAGTLDSYVWKDNCGKMYSNTLFLQL